MNAFEVAPTIGSMVRNVLEPLRQARGNVTPGPVPASGPLLMGKGWVGPPFDLWSLRLMALCPSVGRPHAWTGLLPIFIQTYRCPTLTQPGPCPPPHKCDIARGPAFLQWTFVRLGFRLIRTAEKNGGGTKKSENDRIVKVRRWKSERL